MWARNVEPCIHFLKCLHYLNSFNIFQKSLLTVIEIGRLHGLPLQPASEILNCDNKLFKGDVAFSLFF